MIFNCNSFNPLINCDLSVSGINRIWLIGFGDIHSYTYMNNNLSKIIDYKLNYLPVELVPVKDNGSFTFNFDNSVTNGFTIDLNCSFVPLKEMNRTEFEKLIMSSVSCIVEDRNKRCWLLGETSPLKVRQFNGTSGTRQSDNIYNLQLSSLSSYEPKEIVCLDSNCFSSFQTGEVRQSLFTIENASFYDFGTSTINITADSTPLNLAYNTFNQPLQPTLWSSSTILQQDVQTLTNLISSYTTSLAVQLVYNAIDDEAYIILFSQDTSFNNLYFDTNTPLISQVSITLNINFTVGNLLTNSGTTITVTDALSNVVYSGLYNETLVGFNGVSGLTNDAYIQVGQLYPNGTTFNLTIESDGTCPTRTFTYNSEPLVSCSDLLDVNLVEGRRYEIEFDKFSIGQEYRGFQFNYNGRLIHLYNDINDAHSLFSQFDFDFRQAASQYVNLGFDLSTLEIIEKPKTVVIRFLADLTGDVNQICFVRLFGNDLNNSEYSTDSNNSFTSRIYAAKTSVIGEFNMFTNGIRVTYDDLALPTSNSISGLLNQIPDIVNGIDTELTNSTNGTINNLGVDVSTVGVNDNYQVQVTSAYCPTTTNQFKIGQCDSALSSTNNLIKNSNQVNGGNYQRFVFPTFSGSNELTTSGLDFIVDGNSMIVNGEVSLQTNMVDFCESFNMSLPTMKLASVYYNVAIDSWIIEVLIESVGTNANTIDSVSDVTGTYFATLYHQWVITRFNLENVQNANQEVTMQIETVDPQNSIYSITDKASTPLYREYTRDRLYMILNYNAPMMDVNNISNNRNGITLSFYDSDSRSNMLANHTIVSGLTSDSFDIDALILGNGFNPVDVRLVVINNNEGFENQYYYYMDAFNNLNVYEQEKAICLYGKLADYKVIADGFNEAVGEVDNVYTCSKFRPRTSVDSGLKRYFDMYKIGNDKFRPRSYADTASVTYDSNVIIVSNPSDYQIGQFIIFDAYPDKAYLVRRIRGGQVFLAQLVDLPSGAYNYSVAIIDNVEDDLNSSNLLGQSNQVTALEAMWYQNVKGLSLLKQVNEFYDFLPLIDANLNKLSMICVLKVDVDGYIFSHSDGSGQYVNFQTNGGFAETSQFNLDSVTIQSTSNGNYQTALYTFTIEYDTIGGNYVVSAGVNGESRTFRIGNPDNVVVSTLQLLGVFFDTLSLVDGFAGQISDLVFTESVDTFTLQKYEGYLAYKLGLVSLLPNAHPYKNVHP